MKDALTKSDAKRLRILYKKEKALIGRKESLVDFKEPIVQLKRRSGRIEFYEDATAGRFEFTHSDGDDRYIQIDPSQQVTFDYGSRRFKGYILDEDWPVPLTATNPTIPADIFYVAIEKTLHDVRKWRVDELKAKGDLIWKIGLAAAILIGGYILYKLLVPSDGSEAAVAEVVNQTFKNTSVVVGNVTVLG